MESQSLEQLNSRKRLENRAVTPDTSRPQTILADASVPQQNVSVSIHAKFRVSSIFINASSPSGGDSG